MKSEQNKCIKSQVWEETYKIYSSSALFPSPTTGPSDAPVSGFSPDLGLRMRKCAAGASADLRRAHRMSGNGPICTQPSLSALPGK